MNYKFLIIACLTLLIACKKEAPKELQEPEAKFLVDKIYDYNHNLLADYVYNENNQLVKRITTDPVHNRSSDYEFEYENNRVSKIRYIDYTFPQFNHTIDIIYNQEGNIVRDETYQKGVLVGAQDYTLYEDGKIKGLLNAEGKEHITFFYGETGNIEELVRKVPDDGYVGYKNGYREIHGYYIYDDKKKPDFGIEGIFQFEPLPYFGTAAVIPKNASEHNMLELVGGDKWIYEYNEHGLPETIETKWKDVETLEPMVLNIKYREIK
ncbi:MAG TPA: hypothetical protein DCG19_08075 [Cryomorphaceae bacterium]|nr:hypothetical protein [Owenweeksia sp.]HAD97349.1 hypothetical protein [Cryomorphaceae bacterium]HBF19783.1 hypothetical protein [Cryomorphaceae bacterium]|tara:strand:- start:1203 stop:2000 length:798 start_codon:yes stop_codon:yes gene_type:complete